MNKFFCFLIVATHIDAMISKFFFFSLTLESLELLLRALFVGISNLSRDFATFTYDEIVIDVKSTLRKTAYILRSYTPLAG